MLIYEEILDEIHHIPRRKKEATLGKMHRLMALLGHPEQSIPMIHVAGTNGKGSICKMMAEVIKHSGYQVGLFTSPYIEDFRERIQINGNLIPKENIIEYYTKIKEKIIILEEEGFSPPSEFEVVTAMGFMHFSHEKVDVAIIEVGIGGLDDATNIINPILSVIASITKDHTAQLGNSITSIAKHKAGIIKGSPVVSTSQLPEARKVLIEKANEVNSELEFLQSKDVKYINYSEGKQKIYYDFKTDPMEVELSLLGIHQMLNGGTAILALRKLKSLGFSKISDNLIKSSLSKVSWPGRMEIISFSPLILIDGAHNLDGAISLKESIELYFPKRKIILIIGVLKDKEPRPLVEVLIKNTKKTLFITPNDERALQAEELKSWTQGTESSEAVGSIERAINMSLSLYEEGDLIIAAGSLYTIAELKKHFKKSLT